VNPEGNQPENSGWFVTILDQRTFQSGIKNIITAMTHPFKMKYYPCP